MAASGPIPQSASKGDFMDALGLEKKDNAHHRALYLQMKLEASQMYDSYLAHYHNVRPEYREERNPPWSYGRFTEASISTAVKRIYHNASGDTRAVYQCGTADANNWIIKWMLYHVCRYRDIRNKKKRNSTSLSPTTRLLEKVIAVQLQNGYHKQECGSWEDSKKDTMGPKWPGGAPVINPENV